MSVEERVWWKRVERAADREALIGKPGLMADWSHDMLRVLGAAQPVPPEQCTEEHKAREARRLSDELGRALGCGPMPP